MSVKNGRKELNFSVKSVHSDDEPDELISEIEDTIRDGSMPPWNYVIANPRSRRLSESEKEDLIKGFRIAILQSSPEKTGTKKSVRDHFHHFEDDDD